MTTRDTEVRIPHAPVAELTMPTAEELFGPDKSQPQPEPLSEDSIAWELADQECARLMAEAMNDEPPDEPPPYSGFYESLKHLHDAQTEPADYVLTGVRRRQVTLFLSVTNVGKSTILLNHCLAAAAAKQWKPLLPDAPARLLKVIYFDGESTDDELKQDTLTMLKTIGGKDSALINFVPIVEPAIKGESLDLSSKPHFEFVKAFVAREQPDILVVDTVGALFTLFNENDNAEVKRKVIRPLKSLAKAGNCAVIGVHHIGKRGENTTDEEEAYLGRGASAFGTDTRAVFTLKREKALGVGYVRLTLGKAKGVQFDPVNLRLDFDRRTFELLHESPKVETPYQKVVNVFNGKPLGLTDLEALLPDLSKSTIKRALTSALGTGDLSKAGRGKYQKPSKAQKVHPYRREPFEPFSEPAETVEDSGDLLDGDENRDEPFEPGDLWDSEPDEDARIRAAIER